MKKDLWDIPMFTLGAGLALTGGSLAIIGTHAIRKRFYAAGVTMTVGVFFAQVGTQIAIGAVERMTGKQ